MADPPFVFVRAAARRFKFGGGIQLFAKAIYKAL